MVVLDTNVIIDYLDGKESVVEKVRGYSNAELATTFVNQYELLKYGNRPKIEEALKNLIVYHSNEAAARAAADAYRALKAKGRLVSDNDLLIFGLCVANDEILLTQDSAFKNLQSGKVIIID